MKMNVGTGGLKSSVKHLLSERDTGAKFILVVALLTSKDHDTRDEFDPLIRIIQYLFCCKIGRKIVAGVHLTF